MTNIIDKIRVSGTDYTLSATSSGGNPTVELTQAEYDALVSAGTVSADTYYIITDAQAGDLTNYYTKTETNSAITQAVSGKQDTLVSGTNIKTINNTSILGSGNIDIQGGGGKAVSGGTNISVTTGETADTINCTLPIYSGGTNSIAIGHSGNTLNGFYNLIVGQRNKINYSGDDNIIVGDGNSTSMNNRCALFGYYNTVDSAKETCFVAGKQNYVYNSIETAFGQYCKSIRNSYTFGDSGNTLFSVGNGTANNARHNAFEIRQNGDIYLSNGTNDVKLQDYIQIKAVKISQSDYDQLQTKDPNTLYIITTT